MHWETQEGVCGLLQAGILAYEKLKKHIKPFGNEPVSFTLGLWLNKKQNISFALAFDDFGAKHANGMNTKHLIDALETGHTITVDWTRSLYCGVTLR